MAIVVPSNIVKELRHSKWQADDPHIDMDKADYDDGDQAAAEENTPHPRANRVTQHRPNVQVTLDIQAPWDVLLIAELEGQRHKAEDGACEEGKDGICCERGVVYAETFTNDYIRRVPHKKDHARGVRSGEL
jgi:hypothetical protein